MQSYRYALAGLGAVALVGATMVLVEAGQQSPNVPVVPAPRMPIAPAAVQGASVTPATEGWVKNADGTTTILLGYMNRNQNQTFDIPIGPNNKIEPAGQNGFDYGQPTHFELGRAWGVFTITVPKDFGTKQLTYTISANGQPQTISIRIANGYQIEPYFRNDNGNTPPVGKAEPTGPEFKGPVKGLAATLTATVGQAVPLTVYVTDKANTVNQQDAFGPAPPPSGSAITNAPPAPAPAAPAAAGAGGGGGRGGAGRGGRGGAAPAAGATDDQGAAGRGAPAGRGGGGGGGGRGGVGAPARVSWFVHRSPSTAASQAVKFENKTPPIVVDAEVVKMFTKPGDFTGKSATTVTFGEPGDYVLRAQLNDASGDGGGADQCCWTNMHYKVTVKAAAK